MSEDLQRAAGSPANFTEGVKDSLSAQRLDYTTQTDPTSSPTGEILMDASIVTALIAGVSSPVPDTGFVASDMFKVKPRLVRVIDSAGQSASTILLCGGLFNATPI